MRLDVKTSKHLGVHCAWEDVATFEKLPLLEMMLASSTSVS